MLIYGLRFRPKVLTHLTSDEHKAALAAVYLANGARVVLAGFYVSLQQLDHDSLGQVAGGASLPDCWCVVKGLNVILLLAAMKVTAIPLKISERFRHQSVQVHFVTELQLGVSLQDNGHHHQQLHYDLSVLRLDDVLQCVLHQQGEVHLIHGHVRQSRLLWEVSSSDQDTIGGPLQDLPNPIVEAPRGSVQRAINLTTV